MVSSEVVALGWASVADPNESLTFVLLATPGNERSQLSSTSRSAGLQFYSVLLSVEGLQVVHCHPLAINIFEGFGLA